jgi:hypothetical protein
VAFMRSAASKRLATNQTLNRAPLVFGKHDKVPKDVQNVGAINGSIADIGPKMIRSGWEAA